jgi:hypothetical protein
MAKKKATKRARKKPAQAKTSKKSGGEKAELDPIQAALARRRASLISR